VKLLVKIGGAQLEHPQARREVAQAVATACRDGHEVVVVHGGGNQIRDVAGRLGLPERYHDGLRVTDAATAEVVLMVLGGLVNRLLVQALQEQGLRAVGLTGADGGLFSARPHRPDGADLGFVGAVAQVDPAIVTTLLASGAVPVVATVAPLAAAADGDRSQLYNVNADMAAGPLAAALGADALLFLTDVPAVLDGAGRPLAELTPADGARLRRDGVLRGGMLPKVDAALAAIAAAPAAIVKIAPAAGTDAVRGALRGDVGTRFTAGPAAPVCGGALPAPDAHVMSTYLRPPEIFVGGHGALLRDQDGHEWLDFLGGIAVSALGHAYPPLVDALRDQVGRVIHTSNLYRHAYTEKVAGLLAGLTGLEAVFFTNSGTEANEAALKIARKHQRVAGRPERTGFVALTGGFHGRTMGALSVTHTEKYRAPFEPLIPGVTFVTAGDADALATALHERRPAALILEPIQGESGVRELPADYLRAARELCDATGTVLIHDEVQSGCGRTGTFLAADAAGVKPDIVTLAKPIAAGLPMGVAVVAASLAGTLQPGDHGSTFAGGPLALRGAIVFLEALRDGLLDAVRARGARLAAGLDALRRGFPAVLERRGRGLIQGLRLAHGAAELRAWLHARRMIVNVAGGDVIRLLPAYVITDEQIDRGLALLRDGLAATTPMLQSQA
jgi:acetylglutamate kinase